MGTPIKEQYHAVEKENKLGRMIEFEIAQISRVFLLRQLWIVNYYVKSSSNNLRNENINSGVSVVFKTKHELRCQNELFLKYHFSGNTSLYVFITENILKTFDVITDDP